MNKRNAHEFAGFRFPPGAFKFLANLEADNNRSWFNSQKSIHEVAIVSPALAFATALGQELKGVSPDVYADPYVGGSLSRIYRDVRFSKDKWSSKTCVGIRLRNRDTVRSDVRAGPLYRSLQKYAVETFTSYCVPDVPAPGAMRA
ncbi:MAG: DUF2461 family protein [Opitutae bacterium]|nr:DUF2461 family protein [Opitutae bacterium]